MNEQAAIALLRTMGYRVSKPKAKVVKDRVGPTFVARFADGEVTRMSVFTSLAKLDYDRAARLSCAAYESRARRKATGTNAVLPPIVAAHFEQDGNIIARYGQGDGLVNWARQALAA